MKKILLVLFYAITSHISVFADTVSSATATDIISENTKKVVFCNEIRKIAAEKDISKFLEIKALLKWKSIEKKLTPQARFTFFYSAYVLCSQEKSNVVGLYNPYLDFIFLMKLTASEPLPKISDICLASGVSFRKNYIKENDKNFFSKVRNTNRVFSFLFSKPLDSLPYLTEDKNRIYNTCNILTEKEILFQVKLLQNKKFTLSAFNIIYDINKMSLEQLKSKYNKAKFSDGFVHDRNNKKYMVASYRSQNNYLFMYMLDVSNANNLMIIVLDNTFSLKEVSKINLLTLM